MKQGFSTTLTRGTEEMNRIAVEYQSFLQLLRVLTSVRSLFPLKFCMPSHLSLECRQQSFQLVSFKNYNTVNIPERSLSLFSSYFPSLHKSVYACLF